MGPREIAFFCREMANTRLRNFEIQTDYAGKQHFPAVAYNTRFFELSRHYVELSLFRLPLIITWVRKNWCRKKTEKWAARWNRRELRLLRTTRILRETWRREDNAHRVLVFPQFAARRASIQLPANKVITHQILQFLSYRIILQSSCFATFFPPPIILEIYC